MIYGPTFSAELVAAGCMSVSWNSDTGAIISGDSPAVAAVIAAHNPAKQLVVVPTVISDRQFFQQLAVLGKISQAEALAYVAGGALPAAMAALIAQLSPANQFAAQMQIVGATQFLRSNPLVAQLGTLYGMSGSDLDALWTAAALL